MRTKTFGKVISLFVSVCMLVSLFTCLMAVPVSASASDTKMLYVHSSDSANFFGWRTTSGGLSKATKYRLSLDWEDIRNAPFGEDTFWIYCYSAGWKRVSSSSLTSEWTVSSIKLANGYHYDVDFTTTSPEELRELVLYFGDVNKSVSDMEFKTANWVLYTRDSEENLTDTGLMLTFPATFRGASDNAMNSYINSYTGTDKGQIWKKNGMSSQSEFIDIPEDYFAAPADCTHENTHVVDAEDSTCSTPGHIEYVVCDDCGAILDGEGNELDEADVALELDPDVHEDETPVAAVASTCKTHGHTGYSACSGCGAILDGENTELPLDPNNHVGEGTELRNAVKATADSTGYTGDMYCLGCGELLQEGEVIPALDVKMLHFAAGADGYQVMVYKINGTIEAGVYRFTVDELAETGVKSTVQFCVNGTAYTTQVGVDSDVLDTENNKRVVEFHLWGTKNDGGLIMIGNYGKGNNMETYYRNPAFYLLDGEGNPTGDSLIEPFTSENVVLKTGTTRANSGFGRWTSLNWESGRIMLEDIDYDLYGDEPIDDPDCQHANVMIVPAVASTCTVAGHGEYTFCKKCFNVIEGSKEPLPLDPDNHAHTERRDVVKATRTTDGYTGDIYCTDCGEKIEDGEVIPAGYWLSKMIVWSGEDVVTYSRILHRPDTGKFEKGARYTFSMDFELNNAEDESGFWGIYYRYGDQPDNFNPIPYADLEIVKTALPHGNHYEVTFTVPNDCVDYDNILFRFGDISMNGYAPQFKLANLDLWKLDGEGAKSEQIDIVLPLSMDEILTTEDGFLKLYGDSGKWYALRYRTAGLSVEEQLAYFSECAHEHTEIRDANDPTCSVEGYTGDTYCTDCGEKIALGEAIETIDHTYEWVVTKEPTEEESGLKEEICSVCGHHSGESEEVPFVSHTAGDINGDGSVNNKDLTRLFQYLSDWDVEVDESALDINGDGSVNNKDLTRLFQYLSDWDVDIF